MQDEAKTKEQLVVELRELRERVAEWEKDLPERKRTEEALRERERKFRAIFNQTFQFIGLVTTEGRLIEANKTALQFVGVQESDVLGKPFWETPWWTHSRELQETLKEAVKKAAAGEFDRFEATVFSADGSFHYLDFSLKLLMDEAGGVTFLIAEARDITQTKRAEDELRKSEARYRTLFESIDEGFCIIEKVETTPEEPVDFRYLTVNRAFAAQSGLSNVQGMTIREVVPEKAQEWCDTYNTVLETGEPIGFERELTTTGRILELYAFRVEDETRRRVAVIFKDITQRKRAEETIREAMLDQRHQREFLECLINNAGSCIAVMQGHELRYTIVNPAMQAIAPGVPMVGRTCAEVFPEAAAAGAEALVRRVLDTGEPWFVEQYRAPIPGEPDATWQGQVVRLPVGPGGVPSALVVVWDITERKRMEEALREAWLYNRSLIEASLDPLVTISPEGKITDVNEATIKVTGIGREALIGTDISTYFTEPELVREGYRRAFEKGFVTDYPLTIRHSNGKLAHVLYNASVYRNEAGHVMGVFAAARDITGRKRAEEALVLSEDRYRRLFEDAALGIYRTTPGGKIVDVNPALARMFGFDSPEEAKSLVNDVAVDIYVDPSRRHEIVCMILEGKGPVRAETLYRRRDGSIFTGNVHGWAVRDAKGRILYIEGFIEDITERKRAEEALWESRACLAAIIESIPFEFWAIGPDGRYTTQNRICRERYGDIIGRRPEDVCPNKDILSVWQDNNRRAVAGELVQGEVSFVLGNEQRYFYNIVAPINGHNGTRGIVGINVDITDRKLLEAALKKINDELESEVEERTKELGAKTRRLEEFNSAMKVVLKQREEDRTELEESILMNVQSLIVPYVEKLKKSRLDGDQMTFLAILESHIREITSSFAKRISEKYFGFTHVEVQTIDLIRQGKTTQEIAELLRVSENTVSSNRFHIRKKLGLTNKKVNLRYYLKSMEK